MNQKFYSLLGLCRRAGRLQPGQTLAENAVRSGKAVLIVLAKDASANTHKKFSNSAQHYRLPLVIAGPMEELGAALGRDALAVAAVTDPGFAEKLLALAEDTGMN